MQPCGEDFMDPLKKTAKKVPKKYQIHLVESHAGGLNSYCFDIRSLWSWINQRVYINEDNLDLLIDDDGIRFPNPLGTKHISTSYFSVANKIKIIHAYEASGLDPSAPTSKSKSPVDDDPNRATIFIRGEEGHYYSSDEKSFIQDMLYLSKYKLKFTGSDKHDSLLQLVKLLIAERIDAYPDEDQQKSVILTYDNDVHFYFDEKENELKCVLQSGSGDRVPTVRFSDEDIDLNDLSPQSKSRYRFVGFTYSSNLAEEDKWNSSSEFLDEDRQYNDLEYIAIRLLKKTSKKKSPNMDPF